MTGLIFAQGRKLIEESRDQIEQTAIAVQVEIIERRLVLEERGVERQQFDAVDVLHLFIVGDAVILEGQAHHDGHRQQGDARQIVEN